MTKFVITANVSRKPISVRLTEEQLMHISKRIKAEESVDLSDYIRSLINADMGVSHRQIVVSVDLIEKIVKRMERLEELLESGSSVNEPKQQSKRRTRRVTGTAGAWAQIKALLEDGDD